MNSCGEHCCAWALVGLIATMVYAFGMTLMVIRGFCVGVEDLPRATVSAILLWGESAGLAADTGNILP